MYSELNEADFTAIEPTSSVCFVDEQAGTLESASTMLQWGQLLIQAGGLAMLVESSGKAHSDQEWLELDRQTQDLFGPT